jgi:hypothetical protein
MLEKLQKLWREFSKTLSVLELPSVPPCVYRTSFLVAAPDVLAVALLVGWWNNGNQEKMCVVMEYLLSVGLGKMCLEQFFSRGNLPVCGGFKRK